MTDETAGEDYVAIARRIRGAASELRACAALMDQGYHVFRCEAPTAPFDLVAYRDGICLRVEVKTGSTHPDRPNSPTFTWPRNDEWDLLVIVSHHAVLQFPAPATYEEVRDAVRVAHGFAPLEPKKVERQACGYEGCQRIDYCRGLCNTHYVLWRRAVRQAELDGTPAPPNPGGTADRRLRTNFVRWPAPIDPAPSLPVPSTESHADER